MKALSLALKSLALSESERLNEKQTVEENGLKGGEDLPAEGLLFSSESKCPNPGTSTAIR